MAPQQSWHLPPRSPVLSCLEVEGTASASWGDNGKEMETTVTGYVTMKTKMETIIMGYIGILIGFTSSPFEVCFGERRKGECSVGSRVLSIIVALQALDIFLGIHFGSRPSGILKSVCRDYRWIMGIFTRDCFWIISRNSPKP